MCLFLLVCLITFCWDSGSVQLLLAGDSGSVQLLLAGDSDSVQLLLAHAMKPEYTCLDACELPGRY